MLREKGIGIIPFRREGRTIKYLLLHHGGTYWNFPKGHQDPGEDDLATARREMQEETGITEVKILEGFCDGYDYDFDSEIKDGHREKVYRRAIFYLGEVKDQPVNISDEHIDFGWFDYETALKRLFFQNGQDVLKKAHKFLLNQQDFVI